MAKLIQPVLDAVANILSSMDISTLGELDAFREVKVGGVRMNMPSASIEPGRTTFDAADDQGVTESHAVQIELAIPGTEPEALAKRCTAYAQAVWAALLGSPITAWPAGLMLVFVTSIDYSGTYALNAQLSRYVVMQVRVDVKELL